MNHRKAEGLLVIVSLLALAFGLTVLFVSVPAHGQSSEYTIIGQADTQDDFKNLSNVEQNEYASIDNESLDPDLLYKWAPCSTCSASKSILKDNGELWSHYATTEETIFGSPSRTDMVYMTKSFNEVPTKVELENVRLNNATTETDVNFSVNLQVEYSNSSKDDADGCSDIQKTVEAEGNQTLTFEPNVSCSYDYQLTINWYNNQDTSNYNLSELETAIKIESLSVYTSDVDNTTTTTTSNTTTTTTTDGNGGTGIFEGNDIGLIWILLIIFLIYAITKISDTNI